MARPGSKHPTEGELAILKVLWEQGPQRLSAICEHLGGERKPAPSTVATMLKIMKDKDLVQRVSADTGLVWQAKLTQEKAGSGMLQSLMDQVFEGSAQKVVLHLLEGGKLSRKDQEVIRTLLAAKQSKKR